MAEHKALPSLATQMPPDLPAEYAMLFQIITQCWPLPSVAAACLAQWEASQAAKWAAQAPPAEKERASASAKLAAERARCTRGAADLLAAGRVDEIAELVRKMGGAGWRTYEQFVRSAPFALYKNFARWPGGWPAWLAETVNAAIRCLPGPGSLVELDFRRFNFEPLIDQLKQANSSLHTCVLEDARDKCSGTAHVVGLRLPRCVVRNLQGDRPRERTDCERMVKAALLTYKEDLCGERLPAGTARGWIDLDSGGIPVDVAAIRAMFAELQLEPAQWPHVLVDGRDPDALTAFDTQAAAARKALAIAARGRRVTQQA